MNIIPPEQLLAEIVDVIRTMPPRETIRHETPENLSWFGRASAAIQMWDPIRAARFDTHTSFIFGTAALPAAQAVRSALTMLHQAQNELRMRTAGPLSIAVGQGGVFQYFDEIRKVIEEAKSDILFVDPFLEPEFVTRYLPQVSQGVAVRLLGKKHLTALVPAVELFTQQHKLDVGVRSDPDLHDRYVFIDGQACYQSGASFKDGAKYTPTTLTQIVDAFAAVRDTYEQKWASATVHIGSR